MSSVCTLATKFSCACANCLGFDAVIPASSSSDVAVVTTFAFSASSVAAKTAAAAAAAAPSGFPRVDDGSSLSALSQQQQQHQQQCEDDSDGIQRDDEHVSTRSSISNADDEQAKSNNRHRSQQQQQQQHRNIVNRRLFHHRQCTSDDDDDDENDGNTVAAPDDADYTALAAAASARGLDGDNEDEKFDDNDDANWIDIDDDKEVNYFVTDSKLKASGACIFGHYDEIDSNNNYSEDSDDEVDCSCSNGDGATSSSSNANPFSRTSSAYNAFLTAPAPHAVAIAVPKLSTHPSARRYFLHVVHAALKSIGPHFSGANQQPTQWASRWYRGPAIVHMAMPWFKFKHRTAPQFWLRRHHRRYPRSRSGTCGKRYIRGVARVLRFTDGRGAEKFDRDHVTTYDRDGSVRIKPRHNRRQRNAFSGGHRSRRRAGNSERSATIGFFNGASEKLSTRTRKVRDPKLEARRVLDLCRTSMSATQKAAIRAKSYEYDTDIDEDEDLIKFYVKRN